jgi:hypothetical protein
MDIPTTHPGRLLPAEVKSSEEAFLLKKEHPKTTIPPVKSRNIIRSIICIFGVFQVNERLYNL